MLLLFPPELLIEVIRHLEYQELVAVRQTCRTVYDITKSRYFWYNKVVDICSKPHSTWPELPVETLSDHDLERWALHRLKLHSQWAPPNQCFNTTRIRGRNLPGQNQSLMIPGGRWILTMAESEGSLQVIDLDQDEPKAQKFIPVYSKIPRAFSIWIKKSKGGLSFRVAIYSTNFYVDPEGLPIYFYQVTIEQRGSSSTLVPTPISVITGPQRLEWRSTLQLSDSYILQHAKQFGEPICWELYWYDSSKCQGTLSERTVVSRTAEAVWLFLGDRVAVSEKNMFIVNAITPHGTSAPSLTCLHRIPFEGATIVPAICGYDSSPLIAICNDGVIKEISIDPDPSRPPKVTNIGFYPEKLSTICVTPSIGFFTMSGTTLDIMFYSICRAGFIHKKYYWPFPETFSRCPQFCINAFDESSGRVVVADLRSLGFDVLELV